MNKIFKNLFEKDSNNTLGTIRVSSAILGGLANAYLSIMIISTFLDESIFENIVIAIILLPIAWSGFGFWIIMSESKFKALLKTFIPLLPLYFITTFLG